MKILVFSWRDPLHPLAGGAEQVMHEHMKGWVSVGHTVTLFSSKAKNLLDEEVLDGIKVARRGYQYLGVQLAGFLYYFKNKKRFDFIVDQFHGVPFFTPLYSNKPKMAVIQESAREVWFKNPLPFPVNLIVGFLGYLIEPFIFLFYKKTPFMTGSQSAKVSLVKYGIPEKNITVVSHGVLAPKLKTQNLKKRGRIVTYLGILSKDKGIEDAIKTFAILSKKRKFRFWVVGKGETERYEQKIKRQAKASGAKIKFWGFVSQKKKFELLASSLVLVNPSVHEGWGLVNIEANSVGTPVVAYRSSGLVDSVKDGQSGIICKTNSPDGLAKEVDGLLKKEKWLELHRGAIAWSKKFSWEKSRRLSRSLIRLRRKP